MAKSPVLELERLHSSDYGKFIDRLTEYLRHHDTEIVREVVTSKFSRNSLMGVRNALIDLLGSDYEDIAREAAKAIYEAHNSVDSLKLTIRSLRTEYETPDHMSRDEAKRGLDYLRDVLPTDEAKRQFDDLVTEIWE